MARKTIAERVRSEIAARGLNAYDVARETGIHSSTLHRFITGETGLTIDNLDLVCRLLGLELRKTTKMKKAGRP